MSSLQESLKASSGIDVKEIIENFSGKGNIKQSIHELTNELKESKQPIRETSIEEKTE